MTERLHGAGPSQPKVEIGVALAMTVFAVIVLIGSIQAGIGWGAEGPKAGFIPFYVGLIILGASVVNLIQVRSEGSALFARWSELGQVLSVVIPTAIYVGLIPHIGIYVASALLIVFFMKWLGSYGWTHVLPIAIGVPVVTFAVFEKWFLVALPKGPIEEFLGF
jgi:putative tricarboxylic transport membrane protein